MDDLPTWVKPGVSFRIVFGKGNINNKRYHVRGIVDGQAVLRSWNNYKRRWIYIVESPVWFYVNSDILVS